MRGVTRLRQFDGCRLKTSLAANPVKGKPVYSEKLRAFAHSWCFFWYVVVSPACNDAFTFVSERKAASAFAGRGGLVQVSFVRRKISRSLSAGAVKVMTGMEVVNVSEISAASDDSSSLCTVQLQTTEELIKTASPLTLALIGLAAASTLLAWLLFTYCCWLIGKNVVVWQNKGTHMMIVSIYPVYSFVSFLGFLLPASSILCEAMESAYLSVVLWKMASSMVNSYGGKEALVVRAAGSAVSLRSPPCCCCCMCLPTLNVSRRFVSGAMALILQFLFVRPFLMGMAAVLWANGSYDPSTLSPRGTFLYITVLSTVSLMLAMYGLSLLLRTTKTHLMATMIQGRYISLLLVVATTAIAGLVCSILVMTGTIRCTAHATARQRSNGYYHLTVIVMALVICLFATSVYKRVTKASAMAAADDKLLEENGQQQQHGCTAVAEADGLQSNSV